MSSDFDTFEDTPVYVISVVAQLTGLHAQTLRQYDRLGLVAPQRTPGGGRRYSMRDITRLRQVMRLSAEGIGLAGVKQILQLQQLVTALQNRVDELEDDLERAYAVLRHVGSLQTTGLRTSTELVVRSASALDRRRTPTAHGAASTPDLTGRDPAGRDKDSTGDTPWS